MDAEATVGAGDGAGVDADKVGVGAVGAGGFAGGGVDAVLEVEGEAEPAAIGSCVARGDEAGGGVCDCCAKAFALERVVTPRVVGTEPLGGDRI